MTRVVSFISVIAAALIITIGSGAYWIYSTVTTPREHTRSKEFIKIEKGSTPREIVSELAAEGVLPGEMATIIYLKLFGDPGKLQAGEYQFPSPISPLQVLKVLEKGEDRTIKLTIPEGFTRFDIAKRMIEKLPFSPPVDEKTILSFMDDTSLIKDLAPTATNLEGYMYSNTYSVPRDAKPQDVIKMMVELFRKTWKPEWTETARAAGRTPDQIVTIASLVETETGVEAERPLVAGVINNRLSRGTPLGIDQTNVYIAKMRGVWNGTIHKSDLEFNSPYNTRIYKGLPPGPISSVSESSIKAALYPQSNDYIFYVRNVDLNDGSHWFYSSAAEFEKGKIKYQKWLEQQRVLKRSENTNQQP